MYIRRVVRLWIKQHSCNFNTFLPTIAPTIRRNLEVNISLKMGYIKETEQNKVRELLLIEHLCTPGIKLPNIGFGLRTGKAVFTPRETESRFILHVLYLVMENS